MTKTLLFSVIFLLTGLGFAQPVLSVSIEQPFDEAKLSFEAALNQNEISFDRFLDVGETIRSRGTNFMPFGIYVLKPSDNVLAAIEENPRLAVNYPESLVIYEQAGTTNISTLYSRYINYDFKLSPDTQQSLSNRFDDVWDVLASLGNLSIRELVEPTTKPYKLGHIADEDLEGSMFFYSSIYQDQNMNLVGEIELGSVLQAWLCNASIAQQMFQHDPDLGVVAPCRIFAFKENNAVVLGMVNLDYVIETFPDILENEKAHLGFQEMKEMGEQVFLEMGVE